MSYDRQSSISHYDPFYEDWGKWIDNASEQELRQELRNAKRRVKRGPSSRLGSERARNKQHGQNVWMVTRMERRLDKIATEARSA